MTKREEQELADATRRVVAGWVGMTDADRIERLKAAGILDDAGELAPRYRDSTKEERVQAAFASR